ncbi:MAG TPA: creatininase family protein [Acidobacteriota bacterium]|nr:creatininase family protein [Acidobacteriota bacterium]
MKRSRVISKRNSEKLWFDEMSMKEAKEHAKTGRVVILPIGSVEEHGDHLPLCTDSIQPEYVAVEVAKKTKCIIAPTIRYGVCNFTRNFPGTISIRFDSLRNIVYDILGELIRNGYTRILVLSGHADQAHMTALRLAAQVALERYEKEIKNDKPRIMVCSDYDFAYELKGKYFSEKDGHAGAIETSRVMSIRPDLVEKRGKGSYPDLPRFEIVSDAKSYFPTGAMGDPTKASAEKGKMINSYVIEHVAALVEELKR